MKRVGKILGVIVLVLAIVVIVGFSFLYNNGLSGMSANTDPKEGQIRVACVGDSITYGHGIKGWKSNNYPAILQEILGDGYHVANFGSSGACVNPNGDQPYTSRQVYQDGLNYDADILVFMLGTNDSKPENWTDTETFLSQYQELLGSYLTGDKIPTVYIGLCAEAFYVEGKTSGLAEYDIQPAVVDEIVTAVQNLSSVKDIPVEIVDVHSLTTEHPEWFATDGIHPANDGAAAMAELLASHIA